MKAILLMATNIMTSRRTGANNASGTNRHNDSNKKMEGQEKNRSESETVQQTKAKYEESKSNIEKETMSKHIETRRKIREIADISSFTALLNQTTLSTEDKQILSLHYLENKDFRYIGDMLGFSESTVKRRHKKALIKINKML